ncbi:hypothetical protein L6452_36965 [Arctium lappa]|uniref:Uncharacterized protein n=1 Tax=Arctium lappa TaxID=4217 RepID=A0ACB8Y5V9_ARCLA|nr:hypothetical protein L6452_36965 [Arctium lappa]
MLDTGGGCLTGKPSCDVESATCCIGIFDVAKEKQAQDFDSYHICMCRNCGNNVIHHKLFEVGVRMTPSEDTYDAVSCVVSWVCCKRV